MKKFCPNHQPIIKGALFSIFVCFFLWNPHAFGEELYTFDFPIDSMVASDHEVYLSVNNHLWLWSPDKKEPEHVGEFLLDAKEPSYSRAVLLDDENELYVISQVDTQLKLFHCDLASNDLSMVEICLLDLPEISVPHITYADYQDSILTIALQDLNATQSNVNLLYAFNVETGDNWLWPNCPADNIVSYFDGQLLGTAYDYTSESGQAFQLVKIDIKAQKLTPLATFPIRPETLAYSSTFNQIAFVSSPLVYAGNPLDGVTEQGYLSISTSFLGNSALLANGIFLLCDDQRLLCTRLDPAFAQSQDSFLVIAESAADREETQRFRMTNPGIPIISENWHYFTPADMVQAIQGGDQRTDLFAIRTFEPGYRQLFSKGFYANLSGDDALTKLATQMQPELAKALTYNGELVAFPVDIDFEDTMGLLYSPELLAEIGIAESSLPSNLNDLLSEIIVWYESGKMAGINLMAAQEPDRELISFVIRHFTSYYSRDESFPDYNSPLFSEIIEKADQILRLMKLQPALTDAAPALFKAAGPDASLEFYKYGYDAQQIFLPLSPNTGLPQQYPVYLTVYIVNPQSKNLPKAALFLRSIAEHMKSTKKLLFWPDLAVPVQWPDHEIIRQDIMAEIERLKELQKIAEPEDLPTLRALQAESENRLEQLAELPPLLSAVSIATYRQIAPYIYVASDFSWAMVGNDDFFTMLDRYVAGRMDWPQLIQALDNRAKMMQAE